MTKSIDEMIHGKDAYHNFVEGDGDGQLKRPDELGLNKKVATIKSTDLIKSTISSPTRPKLTIRQSSVFSDFFKKKDTGGGGDDQPDKKSSIGKYLVIGAGLTTAAICFFIFKKHK